MVAGSVTDYLIQDVHIAKRAVDMEEIIVRNTGLLINLNKVMNGMAFWRESEREI